MRIRLASVISALRAMTPEVEGTSQSQCSALNRSCCAPGYWLES